MAITASTLDSLRSRIKLSDVIGERIRLERSGREWKALCPFHEEKTPSFVVNDDKGFYHCFGCGAHGDVFRWLTEKEKLTIDQAAERVKNKLDVAESADNEVAKSVRPKSGGGKLNRSETVTVRLDPKLNYLCELASRAQRRTKSSFIEWAVAESLKSIKLPEVNQYDPALDDNREVSLSEKSSVLWHVDEADRLVSLALTAPALLSHDEQLIWKLLRENGYIWRGRYDARGEWVWEVREQSLIKDRVRENWEIFKAVAAEQVSSSCLPNWQKIKPGSDLDDEIPF